MPSQICFPNHEGLPGQPDPPTVDGFVEPDPFIVEPAFGTAPSEVDAGWTRSSRVTYGSATSVGDVRPLVTFQGIKHQSDDFIYLSFVVRRDTAFDEADMISIVFHPDFAAGSAAKDGDERRIDIFPNSDSVGAGDASGPVGTGSADRRQNRDPRNIEYYRWDVGSSEWDAMAAPADLQVKVESWDLGVGLKSWSVELRVPTTVARGGADWIDFTSSFGFYYNVVRVCTGAECTFDATPFSGASIQFTWPRNGTDGIDRLFDDPSALSPADYEIPPNWLGEAILGSGAACTGVAGVRFVGGASGIGVRNSSSAGDPITNVMHGTNPNYFVARIENDGSALGEDVTATFRIANWGLGPGDDNKWNLVPARGPATLSVAADPSNPSNTNPTRGNDIAAGGSDHDLVLIWELTQAERDLYSTGGTLDDHQCILVLLDSNQSVDFAESSVRRNMNFTALSRFEQDAEVSGEGYPPPPDGKPDHNFILIVSQMRRAWLVQTEEPEPEPPPIEIHRAARRDEKARARQRYDEKAGTLERVIDAITQQLRRTEVFYEWIWITDGYRETAKEFATNGNRYRIYDTADSFGYIGEHTGLVGEWNQSIGPTQQDRDRFQKVGENSYKLAVPHDGSARITTMLEAIDFKIPGWIWLILLLLILLIILLVA